MRTISSRHAISLVFIVGLACTRVDPGPVGTKEVPKASSAATPEPQTTAAAGATGTINLRGVPVRGATYRAEATFEAKDAQLTAKMAGLALSGTATMTLQITDDFEVEEVGEMGARKGRLSHVLDKHTMAMKFTMPDGSEESETSVENGALHGRVESLEVVGGAWRRALEGTPPTPAQARLLLDDPFSDLIYPTSIRVGESWTTRGPELRRWIGSGAVAVSGEVKNTLLAVDLVAGEKVATIESIGEIAATILDEDNGEMQIGLGIKGMTRRSLDRGFDLDGSLDGALKLSGEQVVEGMTVSIAMTGRYAGRFSGSLR